MSPCVIVPVMHVAMIRSLTISGVASALLVADLDLKVGFVATRKHCRLEIERQRKSRSSDPSKARACAPPIKLELHDMMRA